MSVARLSEDDQVRRWRRRILREAGCPRAYAKLLGDSQAELQQMVDMLHKGATPDQIRRIVL